MKKFLMLLLVTTGGISPAWADSYRFLRVGPEAPWFIFLFLLPIVMAPFILMAILYWRFAGRKDDDASAGQDNKDA